MYPILLPLHSLLRWLVLAALLIAICRAFYGWLNTRPFSRHDDLLRHWTATICHIQFMVGLTLYFVSPLARYFISHTGEAIHMREIRFFGMEHITMMFIGIAIISTGSAKAKRKQTDREKFKTMAVWYAVGLLIILSSIPWAFSPLISRPYWRGF
ncbi:hypothetical protein [Hufsiella ginkgonis]|uniref:Cytochrome B n=1 Tax=Hufsiella ginkgonis TaxID=2695274 RepID=A0A7K1XTE3_9SPHI|nr:hypothetical protein [Hufsiella ginkgonis]MXV14283.1 hypothetical protein [Hufsiella ginkgonis]